MQPKDKKPVEEPFESIVGSPVEKPVEKFYKTTRLQSGLGYRDIPPVDDSFKFRLPAFTAYRSRVVVVENTELVRDENNQLVRDERYLIWSPNSSQDPFYPGVFSQLEPPPLPSSLSQRRYDGHRGPSDFTRSPQVYEPARPWLGFTLRETRRALEDVEYAPAHSVWVPSNRSSSDPGAGNIDPYVLWNLERRYRLLDSEASRLIPRIEKQKPNLLVRRPVLLSSDFLFRRLESMTDFDRFVDIFTGISRILREMGAWNRFVALWARNSMCPTISEGVPSADDRYLGVWINGVNEADCLVLLRKARIPCFIIHRMEPEEATMAPLFADFVMGTELEEVVLPQSCREYDNAVTREPKFTKEETQPVLRTVIRSTSPPPPSASLHWQLGYPPSVILPALCLRPSDWTDRDESDRKRDGRRQIPVMMARAVRPDEARDESRSPADASASTPPPIQGPYLKEWTTFREEEDEDDLSCYMRQVGKSNKGDWQVGENEEILYDRKLGRRLIFVDLPADDRPPSLAMSPEFGRPVPPWPFLSGNDKKACLPSKWMYDKKEPDLDTIGWQPRSPLEAPPLLARFLSPEAPVSNGRSEQGETTTPLVLPTVTQQKKPDDDEVSLGPSDDEALGAAEIAPVAAVTSVPSALSCANSPGRRALSNRQDQSEPALGGSSECRREGNRGFSNAARSPSVEPSSSAKAPEATRAEMRAPVEGRRPSALPNTVPSKLTLQERLGERKKQRHRPHARTRKRLKREAEMNASRSGELSFTEAGGTDSQMDVDEEQDRGGD